MLSKLEIKALLDSFIIEFNQPNFIENDPISIPHLFTKKEDIEIAGFLSANLAWGNRKAIIKSGKQLIAWMDNSPYDFITNANPNDFDLFGEFKYRTFNGTDCIFFLKSLQNIYKNKNGLESVFNSGYSKNQSVKEAIISFRKEFFSIEYPDRTQKHIANPERKSAAKRINMFLRWMVRNDNSGVDFGLWKKIDSKHLMLPLDVHTGKIARELGLLQQKQNDWQALEELMKNLRTFDSKDPVKYDFALFGLGVNGVDFKKE